MSAYLIVDIEDLLGGLQRRAFAIDLYDLASRLRSTAALAAGLMSVERLQAIAIANWESLQALNSSAQQIMEGAGFQTFNVAERAEFADAMMQEYFANDPQPIDELIIVATSPQVLSLIDRVHKRKNARVRVWADSAPEDVDDVIYQPLESILGIQSKTVALYIDFENIAISLNEQGYAVNLDRLVEGVSAHAKAHGQIIKMAAYAPWGKRGSLPPLIDSAGREVSDEASSRLALANIDPVFNLPGKNSADMRIAKDVLADSTQPNFADIFIIASGDRDFNEVFSALRGRNKQVIVWGVRGSTSRLLETNPSLQVEYLDDFLGLPRYEAFVGQPSTLPSVAVGSAGTAFTPSQWSSLILQYDRLAVSVGSNDVTLEALQEQLQETYAVVSAARGRDLIMQAVAMGIMRLVHTDGQDFVQPIDEHSIVERTRLVRDRIVLRVANTLEVRGWEYVNYGFLLKGVAMDRDLDKPGMNADDAWRSEWVDCLVREGILIREMVPHRHNPEDLVPVIKLAPDLPPMARPAPIGINGSTPSYDDLDSSSTQVVKRDLETEDMMKRVIVSVDQFTSYRNFTWCPLGSLHRRLRAFDSGVTFQRAVEWLQELGAVRIDEYDNPESPYKTKGISIVESSTITQETLRERNAFIQALLRLYDQRQPINAVNITRETGISGAELALWISIMEAENILNPINGKPGLYSLFRTHHTVNLVAETHS
ncbi:MAG: NYN domain-containing protein [Chloroflexi bacterium CFX4]|nr:NYN domain-containing protein [Chloroflexi bacterium CFX4]MDL1922692.1 NYN domain-containing protein [Chloroflexi bacterium CFX3]